MAVRLLLDGGCLAFQFSYLLLSMQVAPEWARERTIIAFKWTELRAIGHWDKLASHNLLPASQQSLGARRATYTALLLVVDGDDKVHWCAFCSTKGMQIALAANCAIRQTLPWSILIGSQSIRRPVEGVTGKWTPWRAPELPTPVSSSNHCPFE